MIVSIFILHPFSHVRRKSPNEPLEPWDVLGYFFKKEKNRMSTLAERECVPCRGGAAALKGEGLGILAAQLGESWKVVAEHHLEKEFEFKDFKEALAFTNRVG